MISRFKRTIEYGHVNNFNVNAPAAHISEMTNIIEIGLCVVIQRQDYMKYHKLTPKNMECRLGKDTIYLKNIVGEPFWSTFKMQPIPSMRNSYELVKCDSAAGLSAEIMKNSTSGADNRDITDDGSSQKLSTEEIIGLRESGLSAHGIVGTLVENSKTFASKTEYSQEKYLKKKEKKYFEYVIIRKPTLRLIAEIMIGKGQVKSVGIRMDTLAQLTTISNVHSGGRYIVYETGTQGLVSAAMLNAIGDKGTIFHLHSGKTPEKQAVMSLNLPQERLQQLVHLNITLLTQMRIPSSDTVDALDQSGKRKLIEEEDSAFKRRRCIEESAISEIKDNPVDAIVVIGKEHPASITKCLLRYLHQSRPFVVFFNVREPLQEMFIDLRTRSDITALRLVENWLRSYQILPDRTHPDISMSGSGGYTLSGIKVSS